MFKMKQMASRHKASATTRGGGGSTGPHAADTVFSHFSHFFFFPVVMGVTWPASPQFSLCIGYDKMLRIEEKTRRTVH